MESMRKWKGYVLTEAGTLAMLSKGKGECMYGCRSGSRSGSGRKRELYFLMSWG